MVTSGTTIDAISQQLYDRLLDIDPNNGNLLPALATNWQISDDGLTYVFNLRDDVEFHQTEYFSPTRKLSASDIEFTFNRILDIHHPFHQTATEYPYFDSVEWRELVKSVKAVTQSQVDFSTKQT
ncbi:MAG: ABC transporter substrate-binding protein [Rheinheimera sp.]|nr:ABC transporter substrate-binding protein [Rheinheimera sp.]